MVQLCDLGPKTPFEHSMCQQGIHTHVSFFTYGKAEQGDSHPYRLSLMKTPDTTQQIVCNVYPTIGTAADAT